MTTSVVMPDPAVGVPALVAVMPALVVVMPDYDPASSAMRDMDCGSNPQ
ncbi:MAG: hypothetical protein NTX31_09895 [Burkholderiales bacterium]|nr:hypothetical protein [Burkholderiales bacterium]